MAIIDSLFDRSVGGLTKSMDLTSTRNKAIASNIANAETPGYRAVDVDFAGELERAFKPDTSTDLTVSNAKHYAVGGANNGEAHVVPNLSGATKPDGNNVDIDIQMGEMTFNSGRYSSAANLLRKKLAYLKMVVREGAK